MNSDIPQWHVVKSKNEMSEKAIAVLQDASTIYQPTIFTSMVTAANQMMDLYLQEV
jgi:hypothetical protein